MFILVWKKIALIHLKLFRYDKRPFALRNNNADLMLMNWTTFWDNDLNLKDGASHEHITVLIVSYKEPVSK